MKTYCRWLFPFAAIVLLTLLSPKVKATPYASGITNNNGNIQFYLNESGASVVVTFEDSTTTNIFENVDAGTNGVVGTSMLSGYYGFQLGTHSSYAIAVTKFGTGTPGRISNQIENTNTSVYSGNYVLQGFGDPRGLAVNQNPASPYFGRIYVARGGVTNIDFASINPDGSWINTGTAAGLLSLTTNSPFSSPNKISLASNDDLVVGNYWGPVAGVWLVSPDLTTNQLLLGPIGEVNGIAAGVHGDEVGPPVLLGDLNTGATLLTVDGDFYTNTVLVYSNITYLSISNSIANSQWNAPSFIGPQVAVNLPSTPGNGDYFLPSLQIGPSGYLYSGQYRSGIGASDLAFVQVYGPSLTNQLWTSRYNSGNSDYFYTEATGGNAKYSPTCVSVSPDGNYLATVAIDNHVTVCLLTNGIPNVATIMTIAPVRFYNSTTEQSDGGDEIAWDAADNMYVLSASDYGLTTWTLGQSFTYTTYGNATGVTNLSTVSLTPTVSVYATNNPVISQINSYGNPTNTFFTIFRSGPSGGTVTVNCSYSGTATNHTFVAGSTNVVLQPGQTVTNIPISAVTDGIDRKTISLTLTIASSINYNIGSPSATISILNTATPELIPSVGQSSMYNALSNDYVSVVITRLGDLGTTQTLNDVSDYTLTGAAVEGNDYTAPSPVTFNPNDVTQTAYIYPLNAGQVPTHNPNLLYTGNKTFTVAIANGSGYIGSGTASFTIVDSAYPAAQVLFSDPLTNSLDSTNWGIASANGNLDNDPYTDVSVNFGASLYTVQSAENYVIPAPPNGASNVLEVTVNKSGGLGPVGAPAQNPMTAVNAYLTNNVFGGNYAVRFNMNIIQGDSTTLEAYEPGNVPYDAEEGPLFGINTTGTQTNWWGGSGFALGNTQTNFASDGIWYWVSDNGGDYQDSGPYKEFTGLNFSLPNTGWTNIAAATSSTFATDFKSTVFTCYSSSSVAPNLGGWAEGGPGLPVNGTPNVVTNSPTAWSDVEIKQIGNVVSMWIDKNRIFDYTNPAASTFTNGLVMLGYEDPFDGGEAPDSAVYYSNLRVVALTPPLVTGAAYNSSTSKFTFDFTSSDGDLTPSNFAVFGATNLQSSFTSVSGATITPVSESGVEEYQATVPVSGSIHFYRIVQH